MDRGTILLTLVLASTLHITRGAACGGSLTGSDFTTGVITSPGYPGNYPHYQDCTWQIDVTPPSRIWFEFGTLGLEHHDTCGYDFLQITAPGMEPVKFCGTVTPDPLRTPGSTATLTFRSDKSESDKGFNITYTTFPVFLEGILERIERLEAESAALKEKNNEQDTNITDTRTELTGVKQCTGSRVAFTVGLTPSLVNPVLEDQIVKYTRFIISDNAYSSATGIFTCPVAGLYGFSVNLMSMYGNKYASIKLMRNGRDVTRIYTKDKTYYGTGTTNVYLHLNVGDTVDVRARGSSYLYTSAMDYNTFSGVLLSADTCM